VLVVAVLVIGVAWMAAGASARPNADFPDVTLRLASYQPSDDAWTQWAQRFADAVSKKTQGHVKIAIYPNSQLGSNRGSLSAASQGALDMTLSAPQLEESLVPGIAVQFIPGFVHTQDQAVKIVKSANVRKIKNQALQAANLKILSECSIGFLVTISKNPLPTADSYKGVKFRVPDQPNADMIAALGGNPTIIPLSETFTALQLGTVEATPSTVPTAAAQKYYQVAKYIDMTPLAANFEDLLINKNSFAKLSYAEQTILTDTGVAMQDDCNNAMSKASTDSLKSMQAAGAQVVPAAKDYTSYSNAFAKLLDEGKDENALAKQLTTALNDAMNLKVATLTATFAGSSAKLKGTAGIAAGPAVITVSDKSKKDGFALKGPGVYQRTGASFTGKKVWKVTLQPGKYSFGSALSPGKRQTFTVKAG
jgi:TRAP-type C4-dicarboxylate transport system substrate-binding protein